MIDMYGRAKKEAGYNALRFIQMIGEHGGVQTAKILINAPHPSDGYTELWRRRRIDLTVEALVVGNSKWHPLFNPAEIEKARTRLMEYKFQPRRRSA